MKNIKTIEAYLKSFGLVAACIVVIKLSSLSREIIIARRYGVSADMDVFFVALAVALFGLNIFANPFNSALVPAFLRVEKKSREELQSFYNDILSVGVLWVAAISVLIFTAAYLLAPIVWTSFSVKQTDDFAKLMTILTLYLIFSGISTILRSVLNAFKFFKSALLPQALVPWVALYVIVQYSAHLGVVAIPVGLVLGSLVECVTLFALLVARDFNFSLSRDLSATVYRLQPTIRQYFFLLMAAILVSLVPLYIYKELSLLYEGAVSAYSYGSKIIILLASTSMSALGLIVFPRFAGKALSSEKKNLRREWIKLSFLTFLLTGAGVLLMAPFSREIIDVIFFNAFSFSEVTKISTITLILSLGLPFQITGVLNSRLISSFDENQQLIIFSAISLLALGTGVNILVPKYGIVGICYAIVLMHAISYILLAVKCNQILSRSEVTG